MPDASGPRPLTLDLSLSNSVVTLDVYRPAAAPRGAVVLVHGFGRSRATMGAHAAALAAEGVLALTPDLPVGLEPRRSAQLLSELVGQLRAGGPWGPGVQRVVLVGFSAGALAALLAADAPGVVGLLALDPVDRVTAGGGSGPGEAAAASLRTEVWLLRAPASRCNAQGSARVWAARLPALVADGLLDGATHCDFESPGGGLCSWACGAPDAARQAQVRSVLAAAVDRWLPRSHP